MTENNKGLVREIEQAAAYVKEAADLIRSDEEIMFGNVECFDKLYDTLQRAREALRWIPVSERLPEKSGVYRTTIGVNPIGAKGILSILGFDYFDATKGDWMNRNNVLAWMELPAPYTPPKEEKGE